MILAGLLAPPVFTATWVSASLSRPGYDPLRDDLSALSATGAPQAWLMIVGFVVSGLLIVTFALGLARAPRRQGGSRPGAALIGLIGAGMIVIGLFQEDAPAPPGLSGRGSLANQIHDAASVLVLLALVVAPPLVGRAVQRERGGRWLFRAAIGVSLVSGLLTVVYLARLSGWSGLVQRSLIAGPLLWLMLLAAHLLRRPSQPA